MLTNRTKNFVLIYRKSSWTIAFTIETRKKAEKRNQYQRIDGKNMKKWDKYQIDRLKRNNICIIM